MLFFSLVITSMLFILHGIFFFRALILRKSNFKPKTIDRVSKNLSLILLLPALIVNTVVFYFPFSVIVWSPLILILVSNFNKRLIRKNPYALPLTNFILYLLALIYIIGYLL